MKGAIITACPINAIDAAELIYEYLYSDDDITIGQIFEANNFRLFVSMVLESTINKKPLIEVCIKKPVKSEGILKATRTILLNMKGCTEERECLIELIDDVLTGISRFSSSDPSVPSSGQLRSYLSVVR